MSGGRRSKDANCHGSSLARSTASSPSAGIMPSAEWREFPSSSAKARLPAFPQLIYRRRACLGGGEGAVEGWTVQQLRVSFADGVPVFIFAVVHRMFENDGSRPVTPQVDYSGVVPVPKPAVVSGRTGKRLQLAITGPRL